MTTVKTCMVKGKNGPVVINEADFDKSKHELVDGSKPVQKAAPVANKSVEMGSEKAEEKPSEKAEPSSTRDTIGKFPARQ